MSLNSFKRWLDEEDEEKQSISSETQQSQEDISRESKTLDRQSFKNWLEQEEEKSQQAEETRKEEVVQVEETPKKKPGFFKKAIEGVKSFLGYNKEPPSEEEIQKIEAVYNSRTPESVKHSAEIEIAEIDQKISDLKTKEAKVRQYLTRDVKPIEKRTPEERQREEELLEEIKEMQREYQGDTKSMKYTSVEEFANKVLLPNINDLQRSKEQLQMVVENQETGTSNKIEDILKEAVPGFKDLRNIPGGLGAMFSLVFNLQENAVQKKLNKGEELTPQEEVIKKRVVAKREYEKRDISDLQAGMQGVPGSLSMSVDFLLLGPTEAGLKGIPKYLAAAQKGTRIAFSTQLPRMFEQFAERVGDEYETKPTEDGGFELVKMKDGEISTTAAIMSVGNVWANAVTESLGGELVDDAFGFIYRPLAKKFPKIVISDTIKNSKAFTIIQKLYKSETLREYVSRQSPFGELFEEFVQSQVDKITYGEPLGLSDPEAKRITVSTLMMSLIMAPLGLTDLKRGESKELTPDDLDKLPDGLRKEIEQELAGKEVVDRDDMREISQNIVERIESGEIDLAEEEVTEEDKQLLETKKQQLEIIKESNPAEDEVHTWVRNVEDILTYEEAVTDEANWVTYPDFEEEDVRKTLKEGEVTVYSSKEITPGVFVTPSYMEAEQYAGGAKGGEVYSKTVKLSDVAWLDVSQGQYAPVKTTVKTAQPSIRKEEVGTKRKILSNKEVANILIEMGTNDANGNLEPVARDDFVITNQVMSSPQYELREISLEQILEQDEDVNKMMEDPESFLEDRSYIEEEDNYGAPIIIDSKGKVIDGVGRIAGHLVNNDTKIQAYVAINEEVELKGTKGANVDTSGEEEVKFLNALKNFRSKETSIEKIDSINTALEEYSPTLAPNHEFTPEEVTARNERIRTMPALDLTEIVNIVNSLSDKELLTVVKKFRGNAGTRGMFRHKGDEAVSIEVLAALFADPEIASKTVAHEIGHFVDYIPDNKMAGTFASKVAGLKTMGKNFGEFKDAVMREEVYTLSKDVWRPYTESSATDSYVKYRRSGEELYADFISMLFMDPGLLKQQAPHTLEAWISFLDNKPEAKKVFNEAWDLMLETGDELYDKRSRSIREMFNEGDKKLWGVGEANELNKKNTASSFLLAGWKGLKSGIREVETLVVDVKTPMKLIEKKAEKRLGRKLTTEEKITKQVERLQKVQAMERTFIDTYYDPIKRRLDAEGLSWDLMAEYQFLNRIVKERGDITPEEALESLRDISVLDIFTATDKEKDAHFRKVLEKLSEKNDPMLTDFIEEGIKEGKSISGIIRDLQKGITRTLFGNSGPKTESEIYVQKVLSQGGLAKRLAAYLPMKAGVANPLGFTTKTAQQQIDYIKRELGDKKFELLKQIAEKDFRAGSMALLEMEGAQDYFGEAKIEQIKKNDAYVTFAVNYYLDKYIPATMRRQSGTLKGVSNVATATALKNTSLLRAIEFNQMKKNTVEFLRKNDPESMKSAPMRYDAGRGYQVVDYGEVVKMKDWEILYYMDQGKLQQTMLKKDVYNAITERVVGGNFFALKWLEVLNNKWYRPIFVARNLSYNIFNVPRDFLRSWKNNSWVNFIEWTSAYIKATGLSKKSVFNKEDADIIREMKEKGMLGFYRTDIYGDSSSEGATNLFQNFETKAGEKEAKTFKEKVEKTFQTMDKVTEMFEMIPKVAGKITLDEKKVFENDADARDMIVNYLGSPNFQNKGEWYRWYNGIALFSNARKEGWKGDIEVFTGKTPAGKKGAITAILRSAEMSIIPTIFFYMIRQGMPPFDDDDSMWGDLRRLLEAIPTRDFFGFTCIPIGEVMGKTLYIPIARPETEQLVAAITWNVMEAIDTGDLQDARESIINAVTSQIPTLHPLIQTEEAIRKAAGGENPYDRFRQVNVFNPYTFDTMSSGEKFQELVDYIGSLNGMNAIIQSYDPRTYGEDVSPIEKAHQIPFVGHALNRIVRVSNYGIIETSYKEKQRSDKEKARLKKEREAMVSEDAKLLIEQNASLKDIDNKLKEYEEAAIGRPRPGGGYKGDDKETSNDLRKLLKRELIKESGKLPSWRVINANTNKEKKDILLRERENLSDEQFINYLKNLRNSEIVSDDFIKSLSEEGHISKPQYKDITRKDRFKFHPFY